MKVLAIYREPQCSPGRHRSNDALLLEQVADGLTARGAQVQLAAADEALARRPEAALVISMCQSPQALHQLLAWETSGVAIINSPRAAMNTYRDRLPLLLRDGGVRFPETRLIATASGPETAPLEGDLWLKRGDVHASVSADVQRVSSHAALLAGLAEFHQRGIVHAAVQEHRQGAEIKFYGVRDRGFFHWFFTNGTAPVDEGALQRLGERAARAAGLDIFGGDVIVEPDGELTLIDLNDWPSFAPCRDAAAQAIAAHLMRRLDDVRNRGLVSSAHKSAL
jgi:hypothetical protein